MSYPPDNGTRPSAGARRMARHRNRRREGTLCITIEMRATTIDALVGWGLLAPDHRGDIIAVRSALCVWIDYGLR